LELLELYKKIIGEQGDKIRANIRRLGGGLDKLEATNELVAGMKEDLRKLQPVLERSAKETEELLVTLTHEKKDADEMRKVCEVDERETAVIQGEAQELRDVCLRDLDEAMPAFHTAIAALETLNRQDITEIKSFATPPKLVQTVMEAVCVLKGVKPSWENATKMVADTKFLASLIAFDKDNIPHSILKKLKKYIADEDFIPETVAKVSKAAKSLCMWVRAINTYAAVAKKVEPKKAKLAEAEEKLASAEAKLKEKQDALASVMKRIAELQATFDEKQKQKEELEAQMKVTEIRLERANKLVIGLGDEKDRWRKSTEQLGVLLTNLVGNIAVAAGFIAYLGPFTNSYRVDMMKEWIQEGKRTKIPISEDYSLRKISDPVVERDWFMKGLPADDFSVENAILLSRSRRWPLMIDPQGQANLFVKNLERENGMKVIKLSDGKFLQSLENCIRIGTPCLLENVGETLDPALEPVLLKQTFKKGGQLVMRLGDSDVPYSQDFRFYITTKLPNPHFMPELSIKVTIINFTVTVHGLEDQLLAHVVGFERPELEQQKDSLIVQIADGQKQLKEIEDKILQLLANASGDILEDEVLINTLAASKKTSNEINKRVKEAEETAVRIDIARNEYRPVAKRGSLLYFVIADMSDIDPMYQNSLAFFIQLFHKCLGNSERSKDIAVRLKTLLDTITENTYVVICRGLFEKDKIVLSMLVAMQILRGDGVINDAEWAYFLRGSGLSQDHPFPPKPFAWLADKQWRELNGLCIKLPGQYDDIAGHFASHEAEWETFHRSEKPHLEVLPEPFDSSLSPFEKLLLLRVLRPEKVLFGVSKLVSESLGPQFSESPPFDLMQAFKDSSEKTPIVFVLSPGADPAALFINFARDVGFSDRLQMLSLGQGQGPIAERLIEQGMKSGEWVCLQNCHLAASWMSSLEKIVESFGHETMNPDFRLWLTSMPSKGFPVPVLQASIKLTNEPPKGLKANVRRSFAEVIDGYEETSKPLEWKKLLFGLSFFHADSRATKVWASWVEYSV
jgi:dynein heavy chain